MALLLGCAALPERAPAADYAPQQPEPAARPCIAVRGDAILGRHIADANPAFGFLDPGYKIGYVPLPGGSRILSVGELVAIARRSNQNVEEIGKIEPLCFEYATRALDPAEITRAIARLAGAAAIELLDFSRHPVAADGEIEFQSSAPDNGSKDGARIFRGRVRYGGRRTQSLWARAICRFEHRRVVARVVLLPGRPIGQSDLEMATITTTRDIARGSGDIKALIGLAPRKEIPAGSLLDPRQLERPRDIQRGDRVEVEVRSGLARITIASAAESGGREGDSIVLRNLETGRRFRALVAGRGKAIVEAGGNR